MEGLEAPIEIAALKSSGAVLGPRRFLFSV